jgi:von Willebrand factor type A domain
MARKLGRKIVGNLGMGFGLMLAALGGIASCGGSEESLVSPCESELTCGKACDAAAPCGTGQYCGLDSKCTAQCIPGDSRCGDGKRCNENGRCVDGLNLGVGGTSNLGAGGDSGVCASTDVNLDNQTPTVLLLVDQSGSMDARFGSSDRWQVLRTALMDPDMGIVNTLQAEVRFGLALYSGRNGAKPCPTITSVAPAMDNFMAIDSAYPVPTSAIIDDTPTGESIDAAAKLLGAVTEPGPKVIVLATDGEPDTCADHEPNDQAGLTAAKERALQAAQDAFAQGVFTFYISVGNDISEDHAQEMANVGQGYPRDDRMSRFYRANDQAQLAEAFKTIVNGVRTCSFQLNGSVTEGGEEDGTVTLDGAILKLNDPDGWRLSSPTTIELLGAACDAVKNSDKNSKHHIAASFTCGAIVPHEPPA